jgi:hypothetical protein
LLPFASSQKIGIKRTSPVFIGKTRPGSAKMLSEEEVTRKARVLIWRHERVAGEFAKLQVETFERHGDEQEAENWRRIAHRIYRWTEPD